MNLFLLDFPLQIDISPEDGLSAKPINSGIPDSKQSAGSGRRDREETQQRS